MIIPLLSRSGEVVAETLVDDDTYEYLNQWTWRFCKGYASRGYRDKLSGKFINVWMHREVLGVQNTGLPAGMEVDHKNHNTLDNRSSNLRIVSHQVNMANQPSHRQSTSKHLGVYWKQDVQKWAATCNSGGRRVFLGCFESELEASESASNYRKRYVEGAIQ